MALEPIQGQPGLFRDPADPNTIVNIRDYREGDKYDTIAIPHGDIQWGTEFVFFQNIQGKREIDTNLRTPSKLSAGESMVLDRIGLDVRLSTGQTWPIVQDVKSILFNGFYRLKVNDILQDEGPAIRFPSGYGLYGQDNTSGQGVVSNGVPATASTSRLVKKQLLNQNHELFGVLRFDSRVWLTSTAYSNPAPFPNEACATPTIQAVCVIGQQSEDVAVLVTNYLHGLIRAAVSKG